MQKCLGDNVLQEIVSQIHEVDFIDIIQVSKAHNKNVPNKHKSTTILQRLSYLIENLGFVFRMNKFENDLLT